MSLVAARKLFQAAPEPADLARLTPAAIDRLIGSVTFHRTEAGSIREIARAAAVQPDGELPCDAETLLALPGVGPKCAHLALGIACGERRISVAIHVHRVTNRWGYVRASTPEGTMLQLERRLPRRYWIELNSLPGAVRQAHLHRTAAAMLDLSRARHVPAGRGHDSSLRRAAVVIYPGDRAHREAGTPPA